MNKFEQLIEYVINDETEKARELFHDIVVEKSRGIYEQMMEAEEQEESVEEAEEMEEESVEEAEEMEEGMDAHLGGDQADDLIDDIEVEEEGVNMEGEEDGEDMDFGDDEAGEEGLEDRVVDLEDKLDELMAEFENLMGGEAQEEEHDDMDFGMDDDMSDEEVADDEYETEGMMEAVNLKAAPAAQRHEGEGINKKAVYAANSGQAGMAAKPVKTGEASMNDGGSHDSAAYKNSTKDLIGKVQNTPAQSTIKQSPATKPHLAQATGVNNKSVIK